MEPPYGGSIACEVEVVGLSAAMVLQVLGIRLAQLPNILPDLAGRVLQVPDISPDFGQAFQYLVPTKVLAPIFSPAS